RLVPTAVTSDVPSAETAIPSSSVAPAVSWSGVPSGKRCRQMWNAPPAFVTRYIHLPSGDQAAAVHAAPGGPTVRAPELPSNGTTRHGCHTHGGRRSISAATRTHLRSGDTYDRCAMPSG